MPRLCAAGSDPWGTGTKMLDPGMEVIVGVTCDPQLGPMVLTGLGGFLQRYSGTQRFTRLR